MAKVTSKLQVTIPKTIADRYRIAPGQELEWLPAGDAIRVVPSSAPRRPALASARLEIYDRATARQLARDSAHEARGDRGPEQSHARTRGWTREELYERDNAD